MASKTLIQVSFPRKWHIRYWTVELLLKNQDFQSWKVEALVTTSYRIILYMEIRKTEKKRRPLCSLIFSELFIYSAKTLKHKEQEKRSATHHTCKEDCKFLFWEKFCRHTKMILVEKNMSALQLDEVYPSKESTVLWNEVCFHVSRQHQNLLLVLSGSYVHRWCRSPLKSHICQIPIELMWANC